MHRLPLPPCASPPLASTNARSLRDARQKLAYTIARARLSKVQASRKSQAVPLDPGSARLLPQAQAIPQLSGGNPSNIACARYDVDEWRLGASEARASDDSCARYIHCGCVERDRMRSMCELHGSSLVAASRESWRRPTSSSPAGREGNGTARKVGSAHRSRRASDLRDQSGVCLVSVREPRSREGTRQCRRGTEGER
ncbi:hypothetical protein B0H13DRAFT_839606 [Mycena leptocephala]|nr:hypothetical protein B0H13DRAFT_839606 [Mycena leptocephala]